MNIHEYQAKELLRRRGIPVPSGQLAATVDDAVSAAGNLSPGVLVVKAQVHAGGRGKAGGIKACRSTDEVRRAAESILGMRLTTKQTGPEGKLVRKVWIEEGTDVARELYAAVVLDRGRERLCVVASPCGGMDIEEVAEKTPEKVHVAVLDHNHRLWPYQARQIMFACGLKAKQATAGASILCSLAELCVDKDATMAEINPLAVDALGRLTALDAKINFDDSALPRHPDIAALADPDETDPLERKAAELGIGYVRLGGNIGTLVNGAGLAMATMDAIKHAGGEPANFLDAGGGADAERIAAGVGLMLADANLRGILVNIFGGILRCDIVAEGLVKAVGGAAAPVPLVVRMEGTNVDAAREILAAGGIPFHAANSMDEASRMIVNLTREANR